MGSGECRCCGRNQGNLAGGWWPLVAAVCNHRQHGVAIAILHPRSVLLANQCVVLYHQARLPKSLYPLNLIIDNISVYVLMFASRFIYQFVIPNLNIFFDLITKPLNRQELPHFLLFQLLKDALLASSTPAFHSKVVNVASSAHRS